MKIQEELTNCPDIDNLIGAIVREDTAGEAMIHQAMQLKRIILKSKIIAATFEELLDNSLLCSIYQVWVS